MVLYGVVNLGKQVQETPTGGLALYASKSQASLMCSFMNSKGDKELYVLGFDLKELIYASRC